MTVNISVALLHALKVAVKETDFAAGKLSTSTDKILQELLQVSRFLSMVVVFPKGVGN